MLRWIIGVWLASGAVLPAFWLLSMAHRWLASSKFGSKGLCVFSGLVGIGIGALILLFVCSFSDSIITMRGVPSAAAVAQAPMTHLAEARPIQLLVTLSPSPAQFSAKPTQADTDIEKGEVGGGLLREPPSLGEAEQVAPIQPGIGDMEQSDRDDASRQTDAVVPQVSGVAAPPIARLHAKLAAERGLAHRYTRGPPVRSYVTRPSSRGVWLFGPTGNEGANS
jgi:hypothetical protein